MNLAEPSQAVKIWLGQQPPQMRPKLDELRALAYEAMPQAVEVIYHSALGYGPSAKGHERLVYIAPYSAHINLGFFYGTYVDDPKSLLEGTGKRMRHIKVDPTAELATEYLAHLLRSAWAEGRNRFT